MAALDWWECDAEKQMARYWWYCHTGRPLSAHSGSAGQGKCGTGSAFDKCGFCHGEVYFCPGDDKTHCVLQNVSLLNPPIVAPVLFWSLQCRKGGDQQH